MTDQPTTNPLDSGDFRDLSTDDAAYDRTSVPPGLTRVTVNLTPRSLAALEEAARCTGDTGTNIINRAIQLYAAAATVSDTEAVTVEVGPGDPVTVTRSAPLAPIRREGSIYVIGALAADRGRHGGEIYACDGPVPDATPTDGSGT